MEFRELREHFSKSLLRLFSGPMARREGQRFSIESAERIITATKLDLVAGLTKSDLRDELGTALFWFPMINALTSTKPVVTRRSALRSTISRGETFAKFLSVKLDQRLEVRNLLAAIEQLRSYAERESERTEATLALPIPVMHWFVSDYLRPLFERLFGTPATVSRDEFGAPYGHFLDFAQSALWELGFKNGAKPYATETLAQYAVNRVGGTAVFYDPQ